MSGTIIGGALLGALAAVMLNVGKGVQKQKVQVLLRGWSMFGRAHRGDLSIWLLGVAMTAGAAVPYAAGIRLSGSPSLIGAMTGVGLIGLAVFAVRVIGERFTRRDAFGMVLVIVGTSALSALGASAGVERPVLVGGELTSGLVTFAVLGIAGIALGWASRRFAGLAFGAVAGGCIGTSFVLADAAFNVGGDAVAAALTTPQAVGAIGLMLGALIITQFGFFRGRALVVVPAVAVGSIVTPLIFEGAAYGRVPGTLQILLVLMLVAGVISLATGAAGKAAVLPHSGVTSLC